MSLAYICVTVALDLFNQPVTLVWLEVSEANLLRSLRLRYYGLVTQAILLRNKSLPNFR